ncbi:MAG: single-stranded-DNA-specific exonuclease RecJ [Microscillaceae bacterium]|nr:single-stranded-DNA-specific exonuclease RecJ [Microscillaceae bacterium]MDW8461768.1 single-stranded-DNA-specific exonuclease RecJ [Cytophagales bacterium]
MEKRWIFKPIPPWEKVQKLAEAINVTGELAQLLVQRNIYDFEEAKIFFRPQLNQLNDPFLMKNMHKAVQRLQKAINNNERILIYGDYDVDGTTSVALVYGFLNKFHKNIEYYIPDRYQEGYGISKKAIEMAKAEGISLVIALDCGIKSIDNLRYANRLGIDFIICDHHIPGDEMPEAFAILDPKQRDCSYPFKELSGCGVGFKFMQAFAEKQKINIEELYDFLDLVVVSIAADLVPIVGENRVLAYYGLQKLNNTKREGLKALIRVAGLKDTAELEIKNLVFGIGPRINAAGRINHAKKAVQLLLAKTKEEADRIAEIINLDNITRKTIDNQTTIEALEMIAEQNRRSKHTPKSNVLFKSDWHKGVIGIVASRCIEKYYKPTIILTEHEGRATGSARSIPGFDLYKAIEECSDLLEEYGGHAHAAGLTLKPENIDKFRTKFEAIVAQNIHDEQLVPQEEIDLKISFDKLTPKFYSILKQFAPFGPGNMRPVFVTENLRIEYIQVLKEKHLKIRVREPETNLCFDALAFGMIDQHEKVAFAKRLDLCYVVEENNFMGQTNLQLRVKDIKVRQS